MLPCLWAPHPMPPSVPARDPEHGARYCGSDRPGRRGEDSEADPGGVGKFRKNRHQQRARTRTQIGDGKGRLAIRQILCRLLDQGFRIGPRNQNAWADIEFQAPEFLFPCDIGERLAGGAARD